MGNRSTKSTSSIVRNNEINLTEDEDKNENDAIDEKEMNLEDFIIIWLDDDPIDRRLKLLNTVIRSFTDSKQCVEYIKTIKREFIFLIIGRVTLAKPLLYLKEECRQLKSIYVLSMRQPLLMEQWKSAKIFTDISSLIENLENDIKQTKSDMIKIRSIKENEDLSYVWHFLFLKLLYELNPPLGTQKQRLFEKLKEFYKNDEKEVKLIENFQRNYQSQYALWWLTREHKFLLQTLNKALRIKDYHLICAYRFYLKDLYDQMIETKPENIYKKFVVYRTQKNRIKDINKLSNGTLILFDTFLFTTSNCLQTDDTIIEFQVKIPVSQPFARLNENGDLLFYPMSVFRLDSSSDKYLRLIMDQQTDIKVNEMVNNTIQKYSLNPHDPIKMGSALWKLNIGTIQQAYSYHTMLIEDLPPKNYLDLANIHNTLGEILKDNGSYHHALSQFELAKTLYLKTLPHNHLYISPTYANIGNVYRLKKNYSKALDYYLKALIIREKSLPSNHIEIGQSLVDVALCYHDLGLNNHSIPLLNRAKDIFEINKIPKNDSRFIQLEETFTECQEN